jgi:hypothetical protein
MYDWKIDCPSPGGTTDPMGRELVESHRYFGFEVISPEKYGKWEYGIPAFVQLPEIPQ